MMPLSVSSLRIHQVKSRRIHLLRVVPLSGVLVSTKSTTTGAPIKVLVASGDGIRSSFRSTSIGPCPTTSFAIRVQSNAALGRALSQAACFWPPEDPDG
jgi:hypothetical protein